MDVTPVGTARGVRYTRGWVRIVLGVLVALAGSGAIAAGIIATIEENGRVREEAVARGTVGGSPVVVPRGDHTVWLDLDTDNTDTRDLTVRDTACQTGEGTQFRGARQGTSVTVGDLSTVGTFTVDEERVAVACAYTTGTRSSRRRRFDAPAYLVAPGKPAGTTGGVLLIVGGALALVAGILLVAWGAGRRMRR